MKKLNIAFSVILLLVAGFFFFYSDTFKTMPGQADIGPSGFPKVVCVGLAICAVILLVQQIRKGSGEPIQLFNLKLIIGLVTAVAYVALFRPVGFLLTSIAAVFIIMLLLINEPVKKTLPVIVAVSILVPVALQVIFGVLLKVPLPSGVLAFILD